MSIKKQFLQEYRDILKEEQSQGLSMGKKWQDQWPNNHGASEPELTEQELLTRNAANSDIIAKWAHKQVCRHLIILFIHILMSCHLAGSHLLNENIQG